MHAGARSLTVACRIGNAGIAESLRAQAAGVAMPTGAPIGIGLVARHRRREVDVQA